MIVIRRRYFYYVVLGLSALAFFICVLGCGLNIQPKLTEPTRILIDDQGCRVEVPEHPQRILSMTSAFDTILLDIVSPQRIVAIGSLATYEDYSLSWQKARQVPIVLREYNLERIVALHPDVVIVPDYYSKDTVDGLRGAGIPTVVIHTDTTVEYVPQLIQRLADVVNEPKQGKKLVDIINQDLDIVKKKADRIARDDERSAIFLSTMSGYTGTGSLFDHMCTYMHIKHPPSELHYPSRIPFTDERIVEMNPDFVFVPVYREKDYRMVKQFYEDPAYSGMKAVRDKQVLPMKSAYLYTGNQYIGKVMLTIMNVVYPEL